MAEWLYEDGLGEERAILVESDAIVAARVVWNEGLRAGMVANARLISKPAGSSRGRARFPDGSEALVDGLPRDANEGATLCLRITRASIAERGRNKLAQARPAPGEPPRGAPSLLDELRAQPTAVRVLRAGEDAFAAYGWDELVEQAQSGAVTFPGGSLTISPTPAMTLIDIDGTLAPRALALAAVPHIAAALARLDIGGSVGIDFPSLSERRDRQAVDAALGQALAGWRGERTAMNGFGFVQLVSRLERPSLVAMWQQQAAAAAARLVLRRAERVPPGGALLLTVPPPVHAALRTRWLDELARRSGRSVRVVEDASLALIGGFAQSIGL